MAGLFFSILLFAPIKPHAAENNTVIDSNDIAVEQKINDALNDDNVDSFTIISDDNSDMINPDAPTLRWFSNKYKVGKAWNGKDSVGGTVWSTQGPPGLTLGLNFTKSASKQVSATFGVSAKAVSASVGFNISKTNSVTSTGSYKVPSKHNKKKVKRVSINGHYVYHTRKCYAYKMAWNSGTWKKKGTITAKRAYGIRFTKKYTYKK